MNETADDCLVLALLGADSGGAAPLLEKGESCSSRATSAGAIAAFDEAAKVDPKDARPHVPEGRRAGEEGRQPRRDDGVQGGRAEGDFAEAHNNLGALMLARERSAGRRGRVRGRREGEAGVRRGPVQPGRRAGRARQEAGGGRRLQGGGPAEAGRRRLPDEPGRGAAANRRRDGALRGAEGRDPAGPARRDGLGEPGHGAVRQQEPRRGERGAREGDQAEARLRAGLEPAGARHAEAGRRPAAVAAQEKARKLEPKNGAFAADLCRAFIEQKQAPRAVAECKAAVDLEPKNPLGRTTS